MKTLTITTLLLVSIIACSYSQTPGFNHSAFDKLLKANVDENGMVNYEAFKSSDQFNEYLKSIESADVSKLSKENKLAFYINAYNATVINNVLNHWPIKSPMDVDGFFKKVKHKIAGKEMTLDELEHKYTLKIEPVLVHFGLVCAAMSCPKLLRKAYDGKTVFQQLEENARLFLNDPAKNKLDRENKTLYLSEIFKWFKKSFVDKYRSLKNTAIEFINSDDSEFLKNNDVKIKFNKYNWQLNTQ